MRASERERERDIIFAHMLHDTRKKSSKQEIRNVRRRASEYVRTHTHVHTQTHTHV